MSSPFFNLSVLIQHDHDGMPFALALTHELARATKLLLDSKGDAVYSHWSIADGQWVHSGCRAVWVTCELFTEIRVKAPAFTGETDRTVRSLAHSQRISVVFGKDGQPILRTRGHAALTVEEIAKSIASRTEFLSW